ncbi:MAG: hypothetical protein ACFFGZ_04865 [Candidatus Thorarchaeota archaeon]
MTRNERKKVVLLSLLLSMSTLLLPMTHSAQSLNSEGQTVCSDMQIQEEIGKRDQLGTLARTSAPASLVAEFVNPNYPNYQQAFVNVTFEVTVRLTARDFDYTQVNGTLAIDPQLQGKDPSVVLANDSGNTPTKFIGNVTVGEYTSITWKAIPIRFNPSEKNRLLRFNATGLMNGQIPRSVITPPYLIEVEFPIMIVDGPFPAEEHDDVDYELQYKKKKELMLNITSSINGTHDLTGVRVRVANDSRLKTNYSASEIAPLASGEYYLYNFTIESVSKDAAEFVLEIEVISNVTPTYKLELVISVLKAKDEGFGFDTTSALLLFLGAFVLVALYKRRKR